MMKLSVKKPLITDDTIESGDSSRRWCIVCIGDYPPSCIRAAGCCLRLLRNEDERAGYFINLGWVELTPVVVAHV